MTDRKRKNSITDDDEEKELAKFIFGKDIVHDTETSNDDLLFSIDTRPTVAPTDGRVWHDDDEDEIEVDLDKTARLRKLKRSKIIDSESNITGTQFSSLLQERFQTKPHAWAQIREEEEIKNNNSVLDKEDLELMYSAGSMLVDKSSKNRSKDNKSRSQILSPGILDIKAKPDANLSAPSTSKINALHFHHGGSILLTGGYDRRLRLFKIDGDENELLSAAFFKDTPIGSAYFRGSKGEVILGGARPFFYSLDVTSGEYAKIKQPSGRKIKSFERFVLSEEGNWMAVNGEQGYVHLYDGKSKQWVSDVKLNSAVGATCFLGENKIAASGVDSEVFVFDLRMSGKCLSRFSHDDGTGTKFLSSYSPSHLTLSSRRNKCETQLEQSYLSVGAESGVVSIFDSSNIMNPGTGLSEKPKKLKSLMNLTTSITCGAFHPSGQILAVGSNENAGQFKMIHLPTNTVFTNWPNKNSTLGHVESIAFSPGGGYMAVGNKKGKVLLFQLDNFTMA